MLKLTAAEIARELGADFTGEDIPVRAVSTDTRNLPEGCLFIALKGTNFDGHSFITQALESGAALSVSMQQGDWPKGRVLIVDDTRDALMRVAQLHRSKLPVKVTAVTGSVGKTTTKEMIACVSEAKYKTLKTEKNLNNEIGLSHTLLKLDESIESAVVEMGMDGPGQISKLSQTAMPDIAVITSIGVSHIEKFGLREGILAEKMDICTGLAAGGDLILCGDNDLLSTVQRPELNIMRYGINNTECPVRAENIAEYSTHTNFEIVCDGNRFDAQIPCLGRHNVLNALAAFCVGIKLGVPPQNSVAALKNYRPAGMRQNIVVHNSYTIVEDCYNASPDSMRAALDTLGGLKCDGRHIAVFSDMLELGDLAKRAHLEIGEYAAWRKIDFLLCTGDLSRDYVTGASSAGLKNAFYFKTQDLLFEELKMLIKPGDVVWFKASRGMKLEAVIEKIYAL